VDARGLSADEVTDVYRRYGSMLERRCRLLLRDDFLAQDALHELLTMLLRRGESMRNADSPYRWLCRAAERTSLDLLRRRKRVRDALPLDDVDQLGAAPGVDVVARRAVLEALERLDEEQQHLAVLLFVDGLSQGEAANELGVSRVTLNKRAQTIRAALQIELADTPSPRDAKEVS
jgi:RNA polymerase sigma-70 factor (ECF subfamily)